MAFFMDRLIFFAPDFMPDLTGVCRRILFFIARDAGMSVSYRHEFGVHFEWDAKRASTTDDAGDFFKVARLVDGDFPSVRLAIRATGDTPVNLNQLGRHFEGFLANFRATDFGGHFFRAFPLVLGLAHMPI